MTGRKRCYWTYKNAEVLKANGLLDDGAQEFEINMEERGAFDSLLLAPWIMRTWITQEAVACQDVGTCFSISYSLPQFLKALG